MSQMPQVKGACNWHADCRNVHQSCCPWIECSFLYHKPCSKAFQRIWQYIHLSSQPQTNRNHTSPGPPHPASRDQPPSVCITNKFLHKPWVRNHLREAHLHTRRPHRGLDLTAVRRRNWLEWANSHIRWRLALWRGVLFTDASQFSLCRVDGRQRAWHRVGERFANVNVVDRVAHGGGVVMVWAGVCYGQRTQVHFIDCILNAQRYRDEIRRLIVVPFIHDHHLMLQHDNARPHVARICTQFLEAENIPVLAWPAYSLDMSPIEHVWDALDRLIRQRVPVPDNIQQLCTAIEEEWTNIPQSQSTTWSTQCKGDVLHCVRQMVATPETGWYWISQTNRNHTSPGPPHPASRDQPPSVCITNKFLHKPWVRNHLREAHLHTRRPHRGLDLTAVRHRNRLEWANSHIQWRLALWRGVLFTDASQFPPPIQ